MQIIDLAGIENPTTIEKVMKNKIQDAGEDKAKNWCLIVDGTTLSSIFLPTNKDETVPLLRNLSKDCASVICCRMSPLQKAEIISMMKALGNHVAVCKLLKFTLTLFS